MKTSQYFRYNKKSKIGFLNSHTDFLEESILDIFLRLGNMKKVINNSYFSQNFLQNNIAFTKIVTYMTLDIKLNMCQL